MHGGGHESTRQTTSAVNALLICYLFIVSLELKSESESGSSLGKFGQLLHGVVLLVVYCYNYYCVEHLITKTFGRTFCVRLRAVEPIRVI